MKPHNNGEPLMVLSDVEKHLSEVRNTFFYSKGCLFWKPFTIPKSICPLERAGVLGGEGYRYVQWRGVRFREHRLIFLLIKGYLPNNIDHINGVRDDNRIENLRECTSAENNRNKKISPLNTSGVKGVYWEKCRNKWCARIRIEGKRLNLGRFDKLADAEFAVRFARELYHKEFHCHG
jgi:hypothetical protein